MMEVAKVAVFQCKYCGVSFWISEDKCKAHVEKCRLSSEQNGEIMDYESQKEENEVQLVLFIQPQLIVEKLMDTEINRLWSTKRSEKDGGERIKGDGYGRMSRRSSLKAKTNLKKYAADEIGLEESKGDGEYQEDEGVIRRRRKRKCTNDSSESKLQTDLTCPFCKRSFSSRCSLQDHLVDHTDAEGVEQDFKLWEKWPKLPTEQRKKKISFPCKYCLQRCYTHSEFKSHMAQQHPDKGRCFTWKCNFCSETTCQEFRSIKVFVLHIMKNHFATMPSTTLKRGPKEREKCDICNKMFDVYYMRQHKARHAQQSKAGKWGNTCLVKDKNAGQDGKELGFECPLKDCGARLKSIWSLKQHFTLHLENNPYACKVPGCGVKCSAPCHLERHMKLHTGDSTVTCDICGRSFPRKDRLRIHKCAKRPDVIPRPRLERIEKAAIDIDNNTKASSHRRNVNMAQVFLSDPVFIKACEESPGFRVLILGTSKGKPTSKTGRSSGKKINRLSMKGEGESIIMTENADEEYLESEPMIDLVSLPVKTELKSEDDGDEDIPVDFINVDVDYDLLTQQKTNQQIKNEVKVEVELYQNEQDEYNNDNNVI